MNKALYNEHGNKVYDYVDERKYYYEYDNKNNCIQKKQVSSAGQYWTNKYEYDCKNNITKDIYYSSFFGDVTTTFYFYERNKFLQEKSDAYKKYFGFIKDLEFKEKYFDKFKRVAKGITENNESYSIDYFRSNNVSGYFKEYIEKTYKVFKKVEIRSDNIDIEIKYEITSGKIYGNDNRYTEVYKLKQEIKQ